MSYIKVSCPKQNNCIEVSGQGVECYNPNQNVIPQIWFVLDYNATSRIKIDYTIDLNGVVESRYVYIEVGSLISPIVEFECGDTIIDTIIYSVTPPYDSTFIYNGNCPTQQSINCFSTDIYTIPKTKTNNAVQVISNISVETDVTVTVRSKVNGVYYNNVLVINNGGNVSNSVNFGNSVTVEESVITDVFPTSFNDVIYWTCFPTLPEAAPAPIPTVQNLATISANFLDNGHCPPYNHFDGNGEVDYVVTCTQPEFQFTLPYPATSTITIDYVVEYEGDFFQSATQIQIGQITSPILTPNNMILNDNTCCTIITYIGFYMIAPNYDSNFIYWSENDMVPYMY
jgi:hypothetical protein